MSPIASDVTHQVMDDWQQAKPVAALMGEFSSGKSTLLNFLFQRDVATTKVTATPLPPIWFTYSETDFTIGLTAEGDEVEIDLADPDVNFRQDFLAIRRGIACDALREVDIIDTPGISDPDLRKDALRFLFRYIDFVVWCTSASQAWRQTEKSIFERLASSTRAHSILLVTRVDKLRHAKDQDKVLKRVVSEAGDLFSAVVPIKTTKATAVPLTERNDDPEGDWVQTGGFGLHAALANSIHETAKGAVARLVSKAKGPAASSSASPKKGLIAARVTEEKAETNSTKNCLESGEVIHGNASIESEENHKPPEKMSDGACTWRERDDLEMRNFFRRSTKNTDQPERAVASASDDTAQADEISPDRADVGPATTPPPANEKETLMAKTDISGLNDINGFIGACLVDTETGLMMASEGGENFDLETAGAANVEVVKAKMAAMKMLDLDEAIDDILITLGSQFHLIRPLAETPTVFLYTALDKKSANLGMARVQVKKVEGGLSI